MKSSKTILIVASLILCTSCHVPETSKHILAVVPSVEQEASSIWRTINDISFLEEQGYRIHLPTGEIIEELIDKSKAGEFGNDDFPLIYDLLETEVYHSENYQSPLVKVQEQEQLINGMIQELKEIKLQWDWSFKTFDTYNVVFTLYGTGGSYDPDNGTVTLFTTTSGEFMNYENPANTIIHEIVHMGIEQSIIQAYQVPHGLKERIVDTMVSLLFKSRLPEYQIQNMSDPEFDRHLQQVENLRQLPAIIQEYMEKKR